MAYSAGNLELDILGYSASAISSIDATARSLRRLASSIEKTNNTQFVLAGQKLEVLFSKIATSTNAMNTENISNLAIAAKALSSISNISKLEKMDFDKVGKGFESLAIAIDPFLKKIQKAETSLVSLSAVLKQTGKSGFSEGKNGSSLTDGLFSTIKWASIWAAAKKLANVVGDIAKSGSDYYETLNLWQVSMRGNIDLAEQFVDRVSKAYRISTTTLMSAQATFRNMIGSLGQISDEASYLISEALVLMSADYASLYNRSFEQAITQMQSMLAGQVRPIRSAGLDITETTLQQFYEQLGGTKSMRQLTRTEKQLLSILAVFKQMEKAGALGDVGKTIDEYANQTRIFKEQVKELVTWTGVLVQDFIDSSQLLVYINAALITITDIVKALAKEKGLGDKNFATPWLEETQATNDEIDELQGKLLDFDKFRSLDTGGGAEALDQALLNAFSNYSSSITDVMSKAEELAKEWRGIFLDENDGLLPLAKDLISFLESLAISAIAGGLYVLLTVVTSLTKAIPALANAIGGLTIIFGVTSFITGILDYIDGLESLGETAKFLIPIIAAVAGAIAALSALLSGTNWIAAIGIGLFTAGALLTILTNAAVGNSGVLIPNYEDGASDIDSGTIFRAGEFGKTEAVYTGSNGKTNVANVRQMEQAFYNALSRHTREGGGTIVVQAILDGQVVYENTTNRARAEGNVWSKV